jgi:hypothetical protein
VLPGGEIGHDSPMQSVDLDLASDPFTDKAAFRIEHRHSRLVARGLQGENHRIR